MAEVAGVLLTPFLHLLFERVASPEFVDFFRSRKLDGRLLKRLELALLSANAVIDDAEDMQFTKPMVKKWLHELKDAVYDAEDILDEIHTEVLRCKLDAKSTKVRKTFSTFLSDPFVREIEPKIKDVLETLDDLVKRKDAIGLKEGVGVKSSRRSPTTSLVKETDIFGRSDDKEAIINLLLADNVSGNELCVISIVGMGGLGKTTLARLVYNDDRMEGHFDLKAWVCVSDEFDVLKMTKTMFKELGLSTNSTDGESLNWLQVSLQQNLRGKKFLIVLDDVWNKNYLEWEAFSNPFRFGAEGSRVIVTTREKRVATIMRSIKIHDLTKLPKEDCWSLFSKHAFHSGNSNAHQELEVIGRQIVKRCDGLPLAIKTIGALLWSVLDVREWNKILRSEIWDLPSDVIPSLRLSYKYLSLDLKRCFAYCSIFPQDYYFEKEYLILLWMAEGLLPQRKNKTMEQIGDEYFIDLVSRSFFQQSSGSPLEFGMHDLVNDLARFVSGQFTFRHEGEKSLEIVNKTRHLSFFRTTVDTPKKLGALDKAKGLRTFLLMLGYNKIVGKELVHDLLPMLPCLRVLNLSESQNLTELPDSIGKMKHLRHLDVSWTKIRKLPDSICKLCNLQTLKISWCKYLFVLPRDVHKLINLHHLDFSHSSYIEEMPIRLGNLHHLQTLTKFIVSKQSGGGIEELGELTNLGGKLHILKLQNIVSPIHALAASLKDKKHLEELRLEWNDENNISESQKTVLDNLQPHVNLKLLSIIGYGAKSFPDWIGHHSFSNIASLSLINCEYCCVLPPLGQLTSLQSLYILQFDGLGAVGRDFYGSCSSFTKPFGALKVLKLGDMPKLEKWFDFDAENEGEAFTHLEELEIVKCPKLIEELPIRSSSLSRLVIVECPLLVNSLPSAATLRQLELRDCNEFLSMEFPMGLQKLKIGEFDALQSIPERLMDLNSCLEELIISSCHSLASLSNSGLPSTLKNLGIEDCSKIELPMHCNYSSLETLWLENSCDSLQSLPLSLFPNLKYISLNGCGNLEFINVSRQHDLMALTSIEIKDCPNFVSFSNGGLRAPKLVQFKVMNCQSLTSLPGLHAPILWDFFVRNCQSLTSLPELHAPNLWYFSVSNCQSLTSLPDRMHMLYPSLSSLFLTNCPEVVSFPDGGLPSKLVSIRIIDCDKLFANRGGWGLQNLPSIRYIQIEGNCTDVEYFPEAGLLPTSLRSLSLGKFPNMKYLDYEALRHLTSLDKLWTNSCPMLKFMQEEGLPASIHTLGIDKCDLLEKQLQSKKGKAWRKIAHIPKIYINRKLI